MRTELLGAVVIVAVALAGCTGEPVARPCPEAGDQGQPVIGTLLPVTGRLSSIGPDLKRAVDLAIQDVNLAGGLFGRQVEVLHADTASTVSVSRTAADRLTQQGVTAIVGPVSSSAALGVLNQTDGAGTLIVTPGATSDRLSAADAGDRFFRVPPSDGLQGVALAQLLDERGAGSVAVLHLDTSYGRAITQNLQASLEDRQTAQVTATIPVVASSQNHSQAIRQAEAADPATIVYVGFPDPGVDLLAQAHEHGLLDGRELVFTEGSLSHAFVDRVRNRTGQPTLLTGSPGTAPTAFLAQGADPAFRQRFTEAYGHAPGLFAGEAYDAAVTILLGMAAAQSTDPDAVSACLRSVWDPPGRSITPGSLDIGLGAAATGEAIDYETVSASAHWNATGDPTEATFAFWRVTQTGAIEVVEPEVRIVADG